MVIKTLQNSKVILLACGSFNPPTILHLRMFEAARDFLSLKFGCDVVEGIISPVADQFGKAELVSAEHRLKMCQLATKSSSWIRADGWECQQKQWNFTLSILEHHRKELEKKYDNFKLMLLCGADLVDTFTRIKPNGEPLWKSEHLAHILSDYGIVALQRHDANALNTMTKLSLPRDLSANLLIVEDETFPNQLSSTRLRAALREGRSVRYCTPDPVVDYISEHNLYSNCT